MIAVNVRFGSRAYLKLREEVLEYLWRRFAHHCMMMTDPQTRTFINLAATRAAGYGFVAMHEVCSWATLMVYFGSLFDEDPLCQWASGTLHETRGEGRDPAMQKLFAAMNEATNPVIGESGEHYRKALLWLLAQRFDRIAFDTEGSVDEAISRWLRTGYPEKHASLTASQLDELLSQSQTRAREYNLEPRSGAIVCAISIALLGTYNDRDPLYAAIGEALRGASVEEPLARTSKLYATVATTVRRHLLLDRLNRRN